MSAAAPALTARDSATDIQILNRRAPQRPQKKRAFISKTLVRPLKQRIWQDWLRGVTERSLSASYLITREGIEDILREQARLALNLRRFAAATAMALIGIFVGQAVHPQAGEQIAWRAPRSNRGRRGRKRGLDDGYRPAEIRWNAVAGGGNA